MQHAQEPLNSTVLSVFIHTRIARMHVCIHSDAIESWIDSYLRVVDCNYVSLLLLFILNYSTAISLHLSSTAKFVYFELEHIRETYDESNFPAMADAKAGDWNEEIIRKIYNMSMLLCGKEKTRPGVSSVRNQV